MKIKMSTDCLSWIEQKNGKFEVFFWFGDVKLSKVYDTESAAMEEQDRIMQNYEIAKN